MSAMVSSHQVHGARWGPCSQQMFMAGLIHLLMDQESESQASVFPRTPKWYLRKYCMTLTPERAELARSRPGVWGTSVLITLDEPCAYLDLFLPVCKMGLLLT